jgi:hypothetical protein
MMRTKRTSVAHSLIAIAAIALIPHASISQTSTIAPQPLPPNYKTIFENHDILVMRVHYGPHEVVPMHDHSAYPTVFVYLNNSGIIRIDHAPPTSFSVERPPTHTGAFRIAPGMIERHSVTNLSDLPSDFLRVELKTIPPHEIKEMFRGEAPKEPLHSGTETLYENPALRVERIICAPVEKCALLAEDASSVLVVIPLKSTSEPKQNPVIWLPANKDLSDMKNVKAFEGLDEPWEILRIVLPKH